MNANKTLCLALFLSVFSVSALAATEVQSAAGLKKIGTVSASGVTTLSALEKKLAVKAEAAGATSYRIVSAGGENKLYGLAVIYQ
nr:YdgH/BhsA/McbA-like domain containing protein [Raoultella terrigena]